MMKEYHLYVFTQDGCAPCDRLKEHVKSLSQTEQAELDFVPIKVQNHYTALAQELAVLSTPTLVVVHEGVSCDIDDDYGDEFCDYVADSVERFIGAASIIENLQSTLDAYTYAHIE